MQLLALFLLLKLFQQLVLLLTSVPHKAEVACYEENVVLLYAFQSFCEKVCSAGLDAELLVGDCEALPYEDGSFERVSVGFGVRNFEHLELGLSEMHRVLTPGGKLVILELSVPSNSFVRWCYKLYFLKILPAIGGLISGERGAYEYLPASVLRFPAPDKFVAMMKTAGFASVEHKAFTLGICRMYIGNKASV